MDTRATIDATLVSLVRRDAELRDGSHDCAGEVLADAARRGASADRPTRSSASTLPPEAANFVRLLARTHAARVPIVPPFFGPPLKPLGSRVGAASLVSVPSVR